MANKDAPFGFRPVGKVGQNADNGGLSERLISANATAIYQNDLVKLKSDGSIEVAATDQAVVGSLNGVFFTDANTSKPTFANHLKACGVSVMSIAKYKHLSTSAWVECTCAHENPKSASLSYCLNSNKRGCY